MLTNPTIKRLIYDYHIGIDPDVKESGFVVWSKQSQRIVFTGTANFFVLLLWIETWTKNKNSIVFIEAGWLNEKSNFHYAKNKNTGERIAKNVGANHQIGKLVVQYCEKENITYQIVKPTQSKWGAEYFKKVTGWHGRTNSEVRDAARLVFGR